MAIQPLLFANPAIGAAYQSDPRLGYAQGLMQQGASTAPVLSPGEAFARALQAPLGGFLASRIRGGYQAQDQNYQQAMSKALADPNGDLVGALANSDNPYLRQQGMQQELELGMARAKGKIDLQNQMMGKGLYIDPNTGQVQAVPGYGTATGQIAGESTQAQIPADVAKAQALIGPDLQKAKAMVPINAQGAAANAAATMPYDIAKAQTVYNTTQAPQNAINNREKLADDFRAEPAVKTYQIMQPIFESMKKSAGTDSKAADLDMVYGFARLMDPNSVVREGEMIMVNNAQSLPSQVIGYINALNGGQRLTPETRQALLQAAQNRMTEAGALYGQAKGFYANRAEQMGFSPDSVYFDTPPASPMPNLTNPQPQYGSGVIKQYDQNGNLIQP